VSLLSDGRAAAEAISGRLSDFETNISEMEQREQLFTTLHNELEGHEVLKDTVFYPEIDKYPDIRKLVGLAFDEYEEVDTILQEISGLPADKPEWLERIAELKDLVQQHMYSEENKMFPAHCLA
jgi:iron-sulfur cluster repair protein YtfE (RIC family)